VVDLGASSTYMDYNISVQAVAATVEDMPALSNGELLPLANAVRIHTLSIDDHRTCTHQVSRWHQQSNAHQL
jgi:hypothetical protein